MRTEDQFSLLGWALLFLVISLVAALFGFGFVSGFSYTIAKWLAVIFVILFIVSAAMHYTKNTARRP